LHRQHQRNAVLRLHEMRAADCRAIGGLEGGGRALVRAPGGYGGRFRPTLPTNQKKTAQFRFSSFFFWLGQKRKNTTKFPLIETQLLCGILPGRLSIRGGIACLKFSHGSLSWVWGMSACHWRSRLQTTSPPRASTSMAAGSRNCGKALIGPMKSIANTSHD